MTPPNPNQHPCRGCFLEQQREGRVCPAARAQGLPDVETERHAAALHAAILADAQGLPGFAELVRRDAVSHHTGALPASIRHGLLAAPSSDSVSTDSKEVIRVSIPSRTPR
jgi:hypothetical protein